MHFFLVGVVGPRAASADAQLMALKQKMGILPAPSAADQKKLGAGANAAEDIHAEQLELTWQSHQAETEKLKASLRELNDKIEEAKRKKNLLLARQRRAQAQKRIADTMSSMSEKSAFEAFARMEERIETNERQLKASIEIEEEFTGDRLAQDFKQLEKGAVAGSVDVQLLALKQKMGMLPAGSSEKRALGAGRQDEETVHAEIEESSEKKGH